MSQLKSVQEKLRLIRVLRLLKKSYTYEELSKITGLPITVLNRYVRGKVLPSAERTRELLELLLPYINLEEEVKKRIKFDERGFFDNMPVLSDTALMSLIAEEVAGRYLDKDVDKVLTAATDGIALGVHIARELGADIVYAKKKKEVGVEKFYEVSYVPSASGTVMTLYLPQWALKKGENVLIVDDVIRSGETQRALVEMTRQAGAKPIGMFFLVSVGDIVEKLQEEYEFPVESLIRLD
ncbi:MULTISPECIES: phosphoribosyltransferase family protein [Thermococcus]|uniref:Adenine/guanine phosphoribosyltransferase-related PRPP-binding protein n=1 Tax=Thermococcus nautili TaxID=195522 RepID=W8NWX4_9EURY|nr:MULTISPECIES: phosphoribosyltransferase family protein [Thermococcus]AHL23798.1 Adenine/guanine phosphoribosyltransferase-related PRPP-binding protein [Thermococcus nautili]NJE49144.1 helix-turn-helix domain-containing protein [Thermococcus sp. 9N3]CAI1492125.1 Adenine/guanine phosphoribosyltransferase-related PRPP-binding protein [Thermococcus nautili]